MPQRTPAPVKLPEFNQEGNKLFQRRAVLAFPKLVRQAKAERIITYSSLAQELRMRPRNLNKPLGAVADAVQKLSKVWKKPVPPLNFVVVNRHTGMPGKGVAGIVADPTAFRNGTSAYRKRIVDKILHEVFSFRHWDKVLAHFGLQPEKLSPRPVPVRASQPDSLGQGAGESEDHRRLKEFVARNPGVVGLKGFPKGTVEHTFPSSDAIDILFRTDKRWIGVEVKGLRSGELDVRRGLYQCVKYAALMEACLKAAQKQIPIEVILVLGGTLPESLHPEKNTLGVECREGIAVPPDFKL